MGDISSASHASFIFDHCNRGPRSSGSTWESKSSPRQSHVSEVYLPYQRQFTKSLE